MKPLFKPLVPFMFKFLKGNSKIPGISDRGWGSSKSWRQKAIWAAAILIFIWGFYQAIGKAWVCDDAFISFRCAQNLTIGNGLVYNAGERVEAYTNFLWTAIMAGGIYVGLDPVVLSNLLGIFFYCLTGICLGYLGYRIQGEHRSRPSLILPLAAMAYFLQYDSQVFATSGLETSCTGFFIILGFTIMVLGQSRYCSLYGGLSLILAMLCRPDAAIFYIMTIPYLLIKPRPNRLSLLLYLLPLMILYLPYWIIRFHYYGYPFPNSFYAKSASSAYFAQGLIYLWLYFKTYYILFTLLIIIPVAILSRIRAWQRMDRRDSLSDRTRMLSVLLTVPYLFYVAYVGGDFMFARFIIPVVPICLILLETGCFAFFKTDKYRLVSAAIILIAMVLRWNQFPDRAYQKSGIVDEYQNYPARAIAEAKAEGAKLKKHLAGKNIRVAFYGAKAMLVYYSQLPWALECATGLTDSYIAHKRIRVRGRPGHEKRIDVDYLMKKDVNFVIGGSLRASPDQVEAITFDNASAHIVIYQNRIMDQLKDDSGVVFVDFPAYLDRYLERIEAIPKPQRLKDYAYFKRFYFTHNDDPDREARFREKLNLL